MKTIITPCHSEEALSTEMIINQLINEMRAIYPSINSQVKTQADINRLKKTWLLAFNESEINQLNIVRGGLKKARTNGGDFMPTPSKFISWCYDAIAELHHLPKPEELPARVSEYAACIGLCYFQAHSLAEYWLVVGLYKKMIYRSLSIQKLIEQANYDRLAIIKQLSKGVELPQPNYLIEPQPVKGRKTPRDEALIKIQHLKQLIHPTPNRQPGGDNALHSAQTNALCHRTDRPLSHTDD